MTPIVESVQSVSAGYTATRFMPEHDEVELPGQQKLLFSAAGVEFRDSAGGRFETVYVPLKPLEMALEGIFVRRVHREQEHVMFLLNPHAAVKVTRSFIRVYAGDATVAEWARDPAHPIAKLKKAAAALAEVAEEFKSMAVTGKPELAGDWPDQAVTLHRVKQVAEKLDAAATGALELVIRKMSDQEFDEFLRRRSWL